VSNKVMAEGAAGADSDGEDAIITSLRALLGLKMRILASDGRVFQGVFMCIDKGRNIVLSGCEEYNRG
jgi:small nuclear ribonucleoprotein (snRNP)-like protein